MQKNNFLKTVEMLPYLVKVDPNIEGQKPTWLAKPGNCWGGPGGKLAKMSAALSALDCLVSRWSRCPLNLWPQVSPSGYSAPSLLTYSAVSNTNIFFSSPLQYELTVLIICRINSTFI